jgi:hypothetical protein
MTLHHSSFIHTALATRLAGPVLQALQTSLSLAYDKDEGRVPSGQHVWAVCLSDDYSASTDKCVKSHASYREAVEDPGFMPCIGTPIHCLPTSDFYELTRPSLHLLLFSEPLYQARFEFTCKLSRT